MITLLTFVLLTLFLVFFTVRNYWARVLVQQTKNVLKTTDVVNKKFCDWTWWYYIYFIVSLNVTPVAHMAVYVQTLNSGIYRPNKLCVHKSLLFTKRQSYKWSFMFLINNSRRTLNNLLKLFIDSKKIR